MFSPRVYLSTNEISEIELILTTPSSTHPTVLEAMERISRKSALLCLDEDDPASLFNTPVLVTKSNSLSFMNMLVRLAPELTTTQTTECYELAKHYYSYFLADATSQITTFPLYSERIVENIIMTYHLEKLFIPPTYWSLNNEETTYTITTTTTESGMPCCSPLEDCPNEIV